MFSSKVKNWILSWLYVWYIAIAYFCLEYLIWNDDFTKNSKSQISGNEVEPETEENPASHQNLIRLYYQTEAWAGEYDVPKADPTTPPEDTVHEITARWKVSDMINQCDTRKGGGCSGNITGKIF